MEAEKRERSAAPGIRVLAWSCGGFGAGVFAADLLLPSVWVLPLAVLTALAGLAGSFLHGVNARRVRLLLLPAALGLLAFARQERNVRLPAETAAGETRPVIGVVTETPLCYEDYSTLVIRVTEEDLPRCKCRLTVSDCDVSGLRPGDEIRVEAKLSSALSRYGEETENYSSKGIFLRGSSKGVTLLKQGKESLRYAPLRWRSAVTNAAKELFPADTSAFFTALMTGEKTDLYDNETLYYTLSRAGLMHVTAVSGMHVGFLVGFVQLLLPNKRRSAMLMLPLLGLFAALSGFTPSVCRAVLMQLFVLLAPILERENDSPTTLCFSLALLLALNPSAAGSISLQLSFAATAGIVFFSERLFETLNEALPGGRMEGVSRAVSAALGSSLAALVFTLPLSAFYFDCIPVVSPLTNALTTWMISLLFVGGYLALAAGALLPAAGRLLGTILSPGARYVFGVSSLLTGLPAADVYTLEPLYVGWMALAYLLFAGTLFLRRRGRLLRWGVPAFLTAAALFAAVLFVRLNRRELRFTAVDVGQGACTLLEYGDTAVMVDCGGVGTAEKPGQTAAYTLLSRERPRLSALILTHLHQDHANGVKTLLSLIEVGEIFLPANAADSPLLPGIEAAAEEHGTALRFVAEETLLGGGPVTLRLTPPRAGSSGGEECMFVLLSVGEWDALITGDAEQSQERRYLQTAAPPEVEVLCVGHHGSANAASSLLLDALKPETALISVGYNTYGHPAGETLDRLEQRGIEIRRTDLEGSITLKGDSFHGR